MTEGQIYDKDGIFHSIVKASQIMNGRYTVLTNGSKDLDANNLLSELDVPLDKYPLVACMPPLSSVSTGSYEVFSFRLLFLCVNGQTGDHQLKFRDAATNTSLHRTSQDWNDMKEIALGFLYALSELENKAGLYMDSKRDWEFQRFSNKQNDKLSGVIANFSVAVPIVCEYPDIDIQSIVLPVTSHQPHFH